MQSCESCVPSINRLRVSSYFHPTDPYVHMCFGFYSHPLPFSFCTSHKLARILANNTAIRTGYGAQGLPAGVYEILSLGSRFCVLIVRTGRGPLLPLRHSRIELECEWYSMDAT